MDYSFAPGGTPQDDRVRKMFTRRVNTTLIGRTRARNTVHEFIDHLDTDPNGNIVKPVENILLGSHANAQGYLFTVMFDRQAGPTTYEILEDTIGDPDKSIAVPDGLIGYTTGDPVINNFHIKGCNIGKATPFMSKLKDAVGGNMLVTAPVHFHGLVWHSGYGVWELMAYEFKLLRKTAFADRAALLTDLDAAGFTFYNGDAIDPADWEAWTPPRINRTSNVAVTLNLGVALGRRTTIPFDREFRYKREDYVYTISFPTPGDVPAGDAARMAALDTALDDFKYRETDTVGGFDSAHPYPEYERWGYSSKQDFLDEHEWRFAKNGRRLVCSGRFFAYTLIVPITDRDPANVGNVIFNFHPNAGSAIAPVTNLVETDTNFFATA